MLLALLLGCPSPDKPAPVDDTAPSATSCREVWRPRSGFTDEDAVAADADAATFGTTHPDPYQVHLSWADEPSTTMAVVWRTDGDTMATQVQVGTDEGYGTTFTGGSFVLTGGEEFGRVHEVHLCGLTPGTSYHYRVGGEGHWSADRVFRTAPSPGSTERVRLLVAGDSRDNQAVWGKILAASASQAPDVYVFSGDAVDLGTNLDEWNAWYSAGEGYLDQAPVLNIHGNHEFQVEAYYGLVALPGNEQWFSFDVGPAHLVVLNDTVAEPEDLDTQAAWMQKDLAATSAPWKLAFHHVPAYSSCTNHGENDVLQEKWSPVEEAGGVAVDFAGHNHNYERSVPMRGGVEVKPGEGTTYVVSAGAGAELYNNEYAHPYTTVAAVSYNYVIADVEGDSLALTAYDLAGNVLDQVEFTR